MERRRRTCLPIMPMQAIDGVVMVGTGGEEGQVGWRCQAEHKVGYGAGERLDLPTQDALGVHSRVRSGILSGVRSCEG